MDGYEYDDIRQPRWLLIGAAVLVGGVLLAAGFGAGRASAPTGGPARGSTAGVQAGPGPTHVVNGVPVGYAHTEAGAVAAATNFLMVVDGPLVTQPDKYRSAIDTLAAPEAREKQRSAAAQRMAGVQDLIGYARQGRAVVLRVSPLAYHVDRYGDAGATVSIWAETLIAVDDVLSLREGWATASVSLAWAEGDWRLADVTAGATGSAGPVPTAIQPATQALLLPPQLVNYRSYQVGVG
jgi:hypothetical protein